MTRRALATTFGVGWLVLLAMRVVMNYAGASGRTLPQLMPVVLPITAFWLPVIAAALWIQRRPGARSSPVLAAHALLGLLVCLVEPWVVQRVLTAVGMERGYLPFLIGRFDTNVLIYAIIVVGDMALSRLEAFRARERSAARLERALTDAQLHALAIQLQPHFLFNALQFVAETAHADLPVARRTLSNLKELMAQAFALEQRVEVSLREELSFLAAYGEIQKSRFGDRFCLVIDASDDALAAAVPPLLLQPLVENAARHGFGARGSGGTVTVTARLDDGALSILVADDGVGFPAGLKEGQGLSVTRRRLERLHGEAATLSLLRAGPVTEARLRMPFRIMSSTPPSENEAPAEVPHASPLEAESPRLPIGMRLVLFWAALMSLVIAATAVAAIAAPSGAAAPFEIQGLIASEIVGFPFWLAMTIAAVFAGRRLSARLAIALHAVIGTTLTMSHVFMGGMVARFAFGDAPRPDAYQQWAVWDMLVYAALVIIARSHDLRDWVRDKAREEVVLSAEIAAAHRRLARLHLMQADLMAELDQVIASPTMESLDRAVIEFAEFLRGEVMPDAIGAAEGVAA